MHGGTHKLVYNGCDVISLRLSLVLPFSVLCLSETVGVLQHSTVSAVTYSAHTEASVGLQGH